MRVKVAAGEGESFSFRDPLTGSKSPNCHSTTPVMQDRKKKQMVKQRERLLHPLQWPNQKGKPGPLTLRRTSKAQGNGEGSQ